MDFKIRKFNREKDKDSCYRIWKEVGWLEDGQEKIMDKFLKGCSAWVIDLNGSAEFLINTANGNIKYQNDYLPFTSILGVTTSRIARKKGFASRGTAFALAESAEKGSAVAGLGIFEQGFYNNLGFGSGGYEHIIQFDPADLIVDNSFRVPERITQKEIRMVHQSRLDRMQGHGSINLFPHEITEAEALFRKGSFGLGYFNADRTEITHMMWILNRGNEHGPLRILAMSYRNYDQFLELLAVLKSMSDQVRNVVITEPPGIQMQDFLRYPFRNRIITDKGKYENGVKALSYWQLRILNLESCINAMCLPYGEISFNLDLFDPVVKYLSEDSQWRGCAGKFTVNFGKKSYVKPGFSKGLSLLKTEIGAFTRLWMGIKKASVLRISNDFQAPETLIKQFDDLLRFDEPKINWDI